ncbi:hypothetical protein Tco_0491205 [Tanacetum coccineum]
MDYQRTKEYLPRVHHTRQIDEELRESYRTLEKRLFHEGRTVTPSFISENNMLPFFQVVNACTAYMLYYLTIGRKFNFTSMIIYRMEEVINKRKGPMPFAMLLTRLYNHILTTNPQAIVPIARFTLHEHVMDPLDISRNPSNKKGKKIASSSIISSSSSSSDDNEAPSFLEFYDELSDSEDLTKAQREKRGMFKCLNRYVGTITKYLEKQK